MRRLYFLLPNLSITHQVVDELLLKRIDDRHIHVLAKDDLSVVGLPSANLLQKSDVIPALERGLAIGGITGLLAGITIIGFSSTVFSASGGAILGMCLGGAIMGAWASSMIGVDVRNTQIDRFQSAIDQGSILVMVDVPKERVEAIEDLVHRHHPQVKMAGTEPQIPAFP